MFISLTAPDEVNGEWMANRKGDLGVTSVRGEEHVAIIAAKVVKEETHFKERKKNWFL